MTRPSVCQRTTRRGMAVAAFAIVILAAACMAHADIGGDHAIDVAAVRLATAGNATDNAVYRQVEPDRAVSSNFETVSDVSLALAAVPDPRVPRHRRAYDLSIVAMIQGMLDAGYALDRYVFPWEAILVPGNDKAEKKFETDDCMFGVMIFRQDPWRTATSNAKQNAPRVRALYLIPETTTYGLPRRTTLSAMIEIARQIPGRPGNLPSDLCRKAKGAKDGKDGAAPSESAAASPAPSVAAPARPPMARMAKHPECSQDDSLLLLGPNFSGAMDSLAQVNAQAQMLGLSQVCAVSTSATAASNANIAHFPGSPPPEFHPQATGDEQKLAVLWSLARRIGADHPNGVAVLSEASVFGSEVCPHDLMSKKELSTDRDKLCSNAVLVSFPANIADVRAGLRKEARATGETLKAMVPTEKHLSLEDGTGNGSELPDSLQSRLTAAGTEIELRKAIRYLGGLRPSLVIVVATDVRDRLFLFDLLREGVPHAQLVDLEVDALVVSPEYIHATRGAILVASHRITYYGQSRHRQDVSMASTDYQALLRRAVRGIDAGPPPSPRACAQGPILYVVGRKSMVATNCITANERLNKVLRLPVLAMIGVLMLMLASPAMRSLLGLATATTGLSQRLCNAIRRAMKSSDPAINPSVMLLLIGFIELIVAAIWGGGRSTFVLALLALPIYCWALAYQAGTYALNSPGPRPLSQVRHLGLRLSHRVLSMLALALLAAMAIWWVALVRSGNPTETAAVARMAYSTDHGMAIGVAMVIAILALLFTDNAIAVARSASERQRYLLLEGLHLADTTDFGRNIRAIFHIGLFPRTTVMAVGTLLLALCLVTAYPLKVTIFGQAAAVLSTIAVASLSLVSLSFFANAVRLQQRAVRICELLRHVALQAGESVQAAATIASQATSSPADAKAAKAGNGALGLWPAADAMRVRFAVTPAAARIKDAGDDALRWLGPVNWPVFAQHVAQLAKPPPLPADTRVALYLLLASEVSQTRWATFSSAFCSLAVAAFVYLYPVSGGNALVLFNLGLLMTVGIFAGFTAMSLERNEVMSNLLCNRTAKLEFSATLFNYAAFPFVILAICLAIVQVPGVLDWGEGLFKSLLKLTGGSIWMSS